MTMPVNHQAVAAGDGHGTFSATSQPAALANVLRGLRSTPKMLSPDLFYDDAGARLFERICTLPEYYLTRAELEILEENVREIADLAGAQAALIEYGSGAGVKVRLLLDALHAPAAYVPIDVSATQLARVASEIEREYPRLQVMPYAADYTRPLPLRGLPAAQRRLALFPGSTIGNFHPTEAAGFLRRIRRLVGADGALVLGVDRRKDPALLHAAYNDAEGVTAAFNLNLLRRLNNEFSADFDLTRFAHHAFFNESASRIEMHLVSLVRQTVHIGGESVTFEPDESIWTECSYKYDRAALELLVASAGFRVTRWWTDRASRFWVLFLEVA